MRKTYWFGLVMLLTLLLSACAQQATPQATTVPTTKVIEASPTPVEEPSSTVEETGEQTGAAQCGPFNLLDQILAVPDPNLAPVTEDDHAVGPETASMTLIEFSDYQ